MNDVSVVDVNVAKIFESRAEEFSKRIAVVDEGKEISYGEINVRANQVARAIDKQPPSDGVVIFIEQGVNFIIAMLAVLKANRYFIPVDPGGNVYRNRNIMDDCNSHFLITDSNSQDALTNNPSFSTVMNIDFVSKEIAVQNLDKDDSAANSACILYTSGSTGTPKGIVKTHADIVRNTNSHTKAFSITCNDKQSLIYKTTVYGGLRDIFNALLNGASLSIFRLKNHNIDKLASWIVSEKITLFCSVVTVFRHLSTTFSGRLASSTLRIVKLGGEALTYRDIINFEQRFPSSCLLSSGLSSTEAGMLTQFFVTSTDCIDQKVPLGDICDDVDLKVLNKGNAVNVNEVGEIVIASCGVLNDYKLSSALSNEGFRNSVQELSNTKKNTWVSTGDYGYFDEKGRLFHAGRKDDQIKISGNRINLKEIESILMGLTSIQEAVVLHFSSNENDNPIIVAFFVGQLGEEEVLSYLSERLPVYMLPAYLKPLLSFPVLDNGKVDRQALLASIQSKPEDENNELELILVDMWSAILSVDTLNINSNFFEYGADSIIFSRFITEAHKVLTVSLKFTEVYLNPTPKKLARIISNKTVLATDSDKFSNNINSAKYPLAAQQQVLFSHQQRNSQSVTYNIIQRIDIHEVVDVDVLEESIRVLLNRHPVLLNKIVEESSGVKQTREKMIVELSRKRLSSVTDSDIQQELSSISNGLSKHVFDLSHSAPILFHFISVESDQGVLFFVVHHIVFDAYSATLLLRDLCEIYRSLKENREASLPVLQWQYSDYVDWQIKQASSNEYGKGINYWAKKLEGMATIIDLPRKKYSIEKEGGSQRQYIKFTSKQLDAFSKFSQSHSVTPYITALSIFAIVLKRYSGQSDLSIGSLLSGREQKPQLSEMIGYFVNSVVLRININNSTSFESLVEQIRNISLEAIEHSLIPYDNIVETLQLGQSQKIPSCNVWFDAVTQTVSKDNILWKCHSVYNNVRRFDFHFRILSDDSEQFGYIQYDSSIFEDAFIEHFIQTFLATLDECLFSQNLTISSLGRLSDSDNKQYTAWNETEMDFPSELALHHLFEERSRLHPDNVALVYGEQTLSYYELNTLADKMAVGLISYGVSPNQIVPLSISRSVEMVVAILAIFKVGAAYLPLDPELPIKRQQLLIDDVISQIAENRLVLISSHVTSSEGKIAELASVTTLCVEDLIDNFHDVSLLKSIDVKSSNYACLIYTSGTTGKPKGVLSAHKGLVNRIAWAQHKQPLTTTDVVLHKTPFSFDVSIWEIMWPLCFGARLLVSSPGDHRDPLALQTLITKYSVTVLHFVPSMLRAFLAYVGDKHFDSVKQLICSGEVFSADLIEPSRKLFPGACLYNLYGPTEASIDVSCYQINPKNNYSTVPIGKPIHNVSLYILDDDMKPVPIGGVGNLFISGVGLSLGYFGRPNLTDDCFLFSDHPLCAGKKLYKTGDLARYQEDGNIAYLGRKDGQVKVRGYRIELGEIDSLLCSIDGVKQAVTNIHRSDDGNIKIIAYVVSDDNNILMADNIIEYLKLYLPEYMVPSAVNFLSSLPLSSHGKLDRNKLIYTEHQVVRKDFKAPRTDLEKDLVEIWCKVLHLEKIGIHDNFFEIGGDSLSLIRLLVESQKRSIFLTTKLLFSSPSIAALSVSLNKNIASSKLPADFSADKVKLLPAQQDFFIREENNINHCLLGSCYIPLSKSINKKLFYAAFVEVVKNHKTLYSSFKYEGNIFQQVFRDFSEDYLFFEEIETNNHNKESLHLTISYYVKKISISEGPLIGFLWLKGVDGTPGKLLLLMHELIYDLASRAFFLIALRTAYSQLQKNEKILLPKESVDQIELQRYLTVYSESNEIYQDNRYWKRYFKQKSVGSIVDFYGENTYSSLKKKTIILSINTTKKLQVHTKLKNTDYREIVRDVITAAFYHAFFQFKKAEFLVVDFRGVGRPYWLEEFDLSSLVAPLAIRYPVYLKHDQFEDERKLFATICQSISDIPNEGVGFNVLRYFHPDDTIRDMYKNLQRSEVLIHCMGDIDARPKPRLMPEMGLVDDNPFDDKYGQNCKRRYPIEIISWKKNGQLFIELAYSSNLNENTTIEKLSSSMENFINKLSSSW